MAKAKRTARGPNAPEVERQAQFRKKKSTAAARWVNAVHADGQMGGWRFAMARKMEDVRKTLDEPGSASARA